MVAILSMVLLMGCSPGTQIEDLAIIIGTGIDEEKKGVNLTSEIVKIGTVSGNNSSGKSMMYYVESVTDKNVTDAFFKQKRLHSKKVFPLHNEVIVFGESTLKKGITDMLSEFARTRYMRAGAYIVAAKGKAQDVLKSASMENQSISDSIIQLVNREGIRTKAAKFLEQASGTGQGLVIPLLNTTETDGNIRILLTGGAVLYQGKLAGYLDENEMKLVSVLQNQKTDLRVSIMYKNKPVDVELENSTVQLKSVLSGKYPRFYCHGSLSFQVYKATLGRVATTEDIAAIQTLVQKELNRQLTTLVKKLLGEFRSDPLGFGDHLYRYRPSYWKKHQNEWQSMLPFIEITFRTNVTIKKVGLHA